MALLPKTMKIAALNEATLVSLKFAKVYSMRMVD